MGSVFAGARNASSSESGEFFKDGHYRVQLIKALVKKTRKSGECFIAEYRVLESDNPTAPKGCKRTYMIKMSNQDTAFANLRSFVIAHLGLEEGRDKDEIEGEVMPDIERLLDEDVCGAKNSFAGFEVLLDVKTKPQKADPTKSYTHHNFSPASS